MSDTDQGTSRDDLLNDRETTEDTELARLRARARLTGVPDLEASGASAVDDQTANPGSGCCSGKPEFDDAERAEQARREEKARMSRVSDRDQRLIDIGRAHHTKGRM